jgi:hypothetical protein
VRGVGEEREGVRDETSSDLGKEERERDEERSPERPLLTGGRLARMGGANGRAGKRAGGKATGPAVRSAGQGGLKPADPA